MPQYVGAKGWVGVRLEGRIDWPEIEDLITDSYLLVAPKTLAAHLEA